MLFNDVVALVLVFKIQTFVSLKTEPKHQNTNKLINSIAKRKASYLNMEDQKIKDHNGVKAVRFYALLGPGCI